MARFSLHRIRARLRRTSVLDRISFGVLLIYSIQRTARALGIAIPLTGFFLFLSILAVGYLLVRSLSWLRAHLLWSLRNRLIVTYVFIAVVPLVLLLGIFALSAVLLYMQFGAHMLQDELNQRVVTASSVADAIFVEVRRDLAKGQPLDEPAILADPGIRVVLDAARDQIPGLSAQIRSVPQPPAQPAARLLRAAGIFDSADHLSIEASVTGRVSTGWTRVSVSAPMSSALLDTLHADLGPIQVFPLRRNPGSEFKSTITINGTEKFALLDPVNSAKRTLPPPLNWLDVPIAGGSVLEALSPEDPGGKGPRPVVVTAFSVRPSQINRQLLASVGFLGDTFVRALRVVAVIFLVLEVAALITGIVLTRTITRTVAGLYDATQHIRRGDFAHRVRLERRDQLGVLGESFNAMTSSITELIDEQKQRQRLENEISIAREVQAQLFPQKLPEIPGVALAAICRAARVVSGDYYDFIVLGPTRIGIAVADISGKGISAALLMASLQAALRSQALFDSHQSTAQLCSRLNRHLYVNTSDDRYATFFYAVYDSAIRTLTYTNAGHCSPFYISGHNVQRLDQGGTVVGLFPEVEYEEVTVQIAPGSLLVVFSDGLIEPENVYGEEFGMTRLGEEALRHKDSPAKWLAESLIDAAQQWAATPEQADDMTVVVARLA